MNNEIKFKAKKGNYVWLLGCSLLAPSIYLWALNTYLAVLMPVGYIVFLPFFFLLWIYLTTTYSVNQGYIFYRSAFVGGSFSIDSITEVRLSKRPMRGQRPAMANKGMLIKYGEGKEVFIAPSNPQEFLKTLRQRNKDFKVHRESVE